MDYITKKVPRLRSRRRKARSSEETEKRNQEREIRNLILEVSFYCIFLTLFLVMVYHARDDRAYLYCYSLEGLLDKEDKLSQVDTGENIWDWTRKHYLTFMYVRQDWDGRKLNVSTKLVATLSSYRVGPIRIRQHRLGNDSCSPCSKCSFTKLRCSPSWSGDSRSWQNFSKGWKQFNDTIYNTEPVDSSGGGPVDNSGGGPFDNSGGGPVDNSGGGPVDNSGGGPVDNSGGGPVDNSGGGPVDNSGGGPVDNSGGGPVDNSGGGPADKNVTDPSAIHKQRSAAWLYHTWADIGGLPISGLLGVYPPGGYVMDIVGSESEAKDSIQYLQDNGWIDEKTRVVIFEATVYNANINMFVMITVLFEFPQARVVIGELTMYPFRLFNYTATYPVSMIVCDWLVYIALIFFGVREFFFMYRQRWKYFLEVWNILECINLLTSAATIALSVGHAIISDRVSKEANKDQGHFYNFQTVAIWDQLFSIMAAFATFLSTLQILHLLRFNRRMSILGATMKLSASDLSPFSVVFSLVILAFASFCYLTFGPCLFGYRDFIHTMQSMLLVSLGKLQYESLYEVNSVLAPMFIFLYMICIVLLLINFLITIIVDSFAQVREDVNKQPNDFELIDYMVSKATQFFWQFNPFRLLWSAALALKIVSYSKPKSQKGKKVQDSTSETSPPRKRKMLSKLQIKFLQTEIGLDRLEDSVAGLQNKQDAIYILMLKYYNLMLNQKDWKKAIVELHVPSLIALNVCRDQQKGEVTSHTVNPYDEPNYSINRSDEFNSSVDPSDVSTDSPLHQGVNTSQVGLLSKGVGRYRKSTGVRPLSLYSVEHNFRALQRPAKHSSQVDADYVKEVYEPMQGDTSGYISSVMDASSPEAVVPSYDPKVRSLSPRRVLPSINTSSDLGNTSLPAGSDISLLSPIEVVPRIKENVKRKRRRLGTPKPYLNESYEMTMFPAEWNQPRQ